VTCDTLLNSTLAVHSVQANNTAIRDWITFKDLFASITEIEIETTLNFG